MTFSDIDIPISQEAQGAEAFLSSVDQLSVDTLISFGFTEEIARKALKASVSFFFPFQSFEKRDSASNYCKILEILYLIVGCI